MKKTSAINRSLRSDYIGSDFFFDVLFNMRPQTSWMFMSTSTCYDILPPRSASLHRVDWLCEIVGKLTRAMRRERNEPKSRLAIPNCCLSDLAMFLANFKKIDIGRSPWKMHRPLAIITPLCPGCAQGTKPGFGRFPPAPY